MTKNKKKSIVQINLDYPNIQFRILDLSLSAERELALWLRSLRAHFEKSIKICGGNEEKWCSTCIKKPIYPCMGTFKTRNPGFGYTVSGILDLSLSAEREPALSLRSLRAHREVSKALATRVVPSFHLVIIDQLSVSMSKNVKNYPATISLFL